MEPGVHPRSCVCSAPADARSGPACSVLWRGLRVSPARSLPHVEAHAMWLWYVVCGVVVRVRQRAEARGRAQVLPLDVAKTRRQTAGPGSLYDVGMARNLQLLYREGGRRALYAGLTPTLLRAFPANACQWLAWEAAIHALREQ